MTAAQVAQRIKELRHALSTLSQVVVEELDKGRSFAELKETILIQKAVIEELQRLEEGRLN